MELNRETKIKISVTTETNRIFSTKVEPPSMEARQALRIEPSATPVMYQTWSDLLFLHWEWNPTEIQATLPPGLFVDTWGEKAYVTVTPFLMNDVRASFLPEIPGTSDFLELNVRTYVYDRNGIPGVWFYSLDCNNGLAVSMAKAFYSLPYFSADMEVKIDSGLRQYSCRRQGEREAAKFHYRKEEARVGTQPGSAAFFLVERYLLYSYAAKKQRLYSARIHHAPWDLFQARLCQHDDTMLRLNQFDPKLQRPNHSWIASPVRVKIYGLQAA